MAKLRVLITASDFGKITGLDEHVESLFDVTYSRTPPQGEDFDAIIAGTAPLTPLQLAQIPSLEVIARIGVGYDNVPLDWCKENGITATYTPYAPRAAVAEFTVGLMLAGIRRFQDNRTLGWQRYHGRQLSELSVGIIGNGRIGSTVADMVRPWCRELYVNDILPERSQDTIDDLVAFCDIVTLHIPGGAENDNFMDKSLFSQMKSNAMFINTSRGSVVNEDDLAYWLGWNADAYACIDVFKEEPYNGPLRNMANVLLTPHMASCTRKSRFDMENGAISAVQSILGGWKLNRSMDGWEVLV